jgi:chromosome segregation ATPase
MSMSLDEISETRIVGLLRDIMGEINDKLTSLDTQIQLISQRMDSDAEAERERAKKIDQLEESSAKLRDQVTVLKTQMRVGIGIATVVLGAVVTLIFKVFVT